MLTTPSRSFRTEAASAGSDAKRTEDRGRRLTVEGVVVAVVTIFGFRVGARPIHDNSMFTHLRTGVDMLRTGGIPRVDHYSFTAAGHPWVVQSWLAEWTYALANQLGGLRLVVLEQGLLTGLLCFLIARLARTGSPLRTAAAALIATGAGVALWSQRPLLFGFICLALLVTVVERRRSPWLLVPLMWVWVNTHGSFVLGAGFLGAVLIGGLLDRSDRLRDDLRYVVAFVVGLLVSAVNPLGPKLLVFPLSIQSKASVFSRVVEWRSPDFQRPGELFTLCFLVLAVVMLLRRRTSWTDLLPFVGLFALGLIAVRNLPAAGVVLAPVLARAFAAERPAGGKVNVVSHAFVALLVVMASVFAVTAIAPDPIDTSSYPVAAVTYLENQGLLTGSHRLAHQDLVGNYLELRYGSRVKVFIDDRVDMFPVPVSDQYRDLSYGTGDPLGVLDRQHIDVVLWRDDRPLVPLLRVAAAWQQAYAKGHWVVFTRR